MLTVNERTGLEYAARFFDAENQPAFPASAHWRLDCETSGKVLQDWTALTVVVSTSAGLVSSVFANIDIAAGLNVIQQNANTRELKTLLVVAGKDTDREYSEELKYWVRNTRGRS